MRVDDAKFEDGWLMLKATAADTRKWLWDFKAGEYEIKRSRKKRSLNANAYAWSLMGQIAQKIGVPTEEVYRHCIENIGGQTTTLTISKNALRSFTTAFVGEHIGRKVQVIGNTGNAVDVLITYGSSDYDAQQMSQLIDSVVQECRVLGIETLEDYRINQIIADWEAHYGQ